MHPGIRSNPRDLLSDERETRIRAVMNSVADGIVTLDQNGTIESINPAAERIFGYSAPEIIGQNVHRLMPEASQTAQPAPTSTSPTLVIGDRREVTGYYRDGSPLSVELTLSEARLDGRLLCIAVVHDLTDSKRAEQRRSVQYAVSSALAGARTLHVAISEILHVIAEGFGWQLGMFWSVDRSTNALDCRAIWRARGLAADEFVDRCREITLECGAGLPGRAWKSRQPQSITDITEGDGLRRGLQPATDAGLHGAFAFPIQAGSDVVGVIELFSRQVRPADLDLILTVTAIGQQIGQFIERERAEEAVYASEARKRAIFEAALDCMITMDHQGRIIECNAAAEQAFGLAREELVGKDLAGLIATESVHEADRAGLARYATHADGPMLNRRVEVSALRADGTEFPVELSITPIPTGEPALFTAVLRDITRRKHAEREIRALNAGLEQRVHERTAQLESALDERKWAAETLEQMRRRNELILTSAGEGIYGVDRNGRATFVNPAAAALTGYQVSQLLSRRLHQVLRHSAPDGTPYQLASCPVCAVLQDGSIRRAPDGVFWRQDGSSFPVSYTSTPIWEQSEIVGAVVTFQDVTERQAMDKLKDDFVSMVSHEIRTPMNGVLGMVELLLDTPLNGRQREYADAVRRSGETLLGIVNDILDSSKMRAGKLELEASDLDVRAVAEDVVGLFAAQAQEKGLEIGCLVQRDVPRGLLGDQGRLRQILLNLVGNAVKFTEVGQVVLRARLARRARDAAVIRFEVADTGPGIAPEAAPRIFQPFSQADRSTTRKYGGTGLGLTISKRLVELMGGEIGLETRPGQGSTFWFTARFTRQRMPAGAPPPADVRNLHVLVVDGSLATRAVLEEHLTTWGVSIHGVDSDQAALEALRAAASSGRRFDVVLLDRRGPGMEGLELARQVRLDAQLAGTQLVLLSPLIGDPLPPDAEALGVAAWLTKPVRQSQLFDTLISIARGSTEARLGAAATLSPPLSATAMAEPAGPLILVVEDTPINQQVARGMLTRLGYGTDLVSNGVEALDALSRGSYAAILMDCHMPEMDGFEASREIRKREGASKHTPIIAMTASAMRGERERCLAAGMDDYLAKPVRLHELRGRLRRWSGVCEPDAPLDWETTTETVGSPDQPSPEGAEIDPQVLLGMRALRLPGDENPVVRLIDLFLRHAPVRLARIRAALQEADARALQDAAHALRGSASTLGALRMQELCAELEDVSGSGTISGAAEVVQALETAFERARPELEALRTAEDDESG